MKSAQNLVLKAFYRFIVMIIIAQNILSVNLKRMKRNSLFLSKSKELNDEVLECFNNYWDLSDSLYLSVSEINECGANIAEYRWWIQNYRPETMPPGSEVVITEFRPKLIEEKKKKSKKDKKINDEDDKDNKDNKEDKEDDKDNKDNKEDKEDEKDEKNKKDEDNKEDKEDEENKKDKEDEENKKDKDVEDKEDNKEEDENDEDDNEENDEDDNKDKDDNEE